MKTKVINRNLLLTISQILDINRKNFRSSPNIKGMLSCGLFWVDLYPNVFLGENY